MSVKQISVEITPHSTALPGDMAYHACLVRVHTYGREPFTVQQIISDDEFTCRFERVMAMTTKMIIAEMAKS